VEGVPTLFLVVGEVEEVGIPCLGVVEGVGAGCGRSRAGVVGMEGIQQDSRLQGLAGVGVGVEVEGVLKGMWLPCLAGEVGMEGAQQWSRGVVVQVGVGWVQLAVEPF
jgi:hypothetical protein